ncbi:MAG: guanylate kinase [Candidatus Krumholzibacteriota bacterium]|nr:guanylate kinase [Candidatus Krumholzibacteriota bacterium]
MEAESAGALAIVVSGPSGSGKTTLVKHLMLRYPRSHFSISATTRALRGEEIDGVDYRFLSREDFLALRDAGGLLEWAEVHGQFYGTPRSEVVPHLQDGRHVFLDIDVQGALSVKEALGERAFLLFVLPPDLATLEGRLRGRGTDAEAIVALRMRNALAELARLPGFEAVVVNRDLPAMVDDALALIEARRRNLAAWLEDGGRDFVREAFGVELAQDR